MTGACPCCGKTRELEREHHALGMICDGCHRAISWDVGYQLRSGFMPVAYETGRAIRARRGSNRVA